MSDSTPTALYRVFGDADLLLYIGISDTFGKRWQQHAHSQPWWPEVRRQQVDWYSSREEAERAEPEAIRAEHPRYNIQHNVGAPRPHGPRHRPPHAVELDKGVGMLIRDYRKREGLSQAAFAARMSELGHGWHQSTVHKVELNVRPLDLWEAEHFAGFLGVTLEDLAKQAHLVARSPS